LEPDVAGLVKVNRIAFRRPFFSCFVTFPALAAQYDEEAIKPDMKNLIELADSNFELESKV